MLREAQRLATERGISNVRWIQGRAENLPADLGTFRLVTFAASFHWLNRPLVARTVRAMLDTGGAVVHIDNRHQDGPFPGDDGLPSLPVDRIAELRRAYLGPDTRAGQGIRNTSPDDETSIFRGAGFSGPDVVVVPDGRTIVRNVDDLVAHTFSMHSTAPHLFGDQLSRFEADLRQALADAASPAGAFSVRLPDNKLNVWRPGRCIQPSGGSDTRTWVSRVLRRVSGHSHTRSVH
jgi:hypothetical protein